MPQAAAQARAHGGAVAFDEFGPLIRYGAWHTLAGHPDGGFQVRGKPDGIAILTKQNKTKTKKTLLDLSRTEDRSWDHAESLHACRSRAAQ